MSETNDLKYEIGKVYSINVSDLTRNPQQPREHFDENEIKALANSIENDGLLQNITFTCSDNQLTVISGERRLRACKLLGESTIQGKYVEGDLLTLALIENIFRSDLTAVELSESVAALKEKEQCNNDEIAEKIGKAKSTTSEILSLVNLTEEIREDARNRPEMTRERLLKIAKKDDANVQQEMYDKLCKKLETHTKTAKKATNKPADHSIKGNRFVIAHVSRINKLTEDLQASNAKMLEKNKKALTDEEKQLRTNALKKMREVVETLTQQITNDNEYGVTTITSTL